MKKEQIAAQLYTLRDYTKTPQDIASTLKRVKKLGFDAVQISGLGPVDYKELAKMLEGEGLVCCASHDGGDELLNTPEKVIERLKLVNCKYTAYPWPHTNPSCEADFHELAKRLNKAGEAFYKAGMTLCYHNHDIEFLRVGDGVGLDVIYRETDPRYLQGEPDVYWVQHGGGNPTAWINKLSGRLPLLHLKEYGYADHKVMMMEVGSGNLDWHSIVPAAEKAGCKWFIIEEDVCRIDPFDSLKMSFDYLVKEFC